MFRSQRDRIFTGVCGGIAEAIGIPSVFIRAGFAAAVAIFGCGILLYLLLFLIMPLEE
jgi:phage shock protein C